jgi:hypothetical protein
MRWYECVAYFLRGGPSSRTRFPHLGNGVLGHPFQSPFRVTAPERLW